MAHLHVKVTNSLGEFEGIIAIAPADGANADKIMVNLINNINNIDFLSLENEGQATVFGKELLKQSVVSIKVVA